MTKKLSGSQDLLTYYNLLPIYKRFVKPSLEKSELNPTLVSYISELPGRLEFEPDGYLLGLMKDPQAAENGQEIKPLESDTLREAFSLREGPIPGFDASILGTDDTTNGMNDGRLQERAVALGEDGERRAKKKKKKRHDEEGHVHGEHKKKKKKRDDMDV